MTVTLRANADLSQSLLDAETHYRGRHPASAARHSEATRHMPGGNTRTVLHYSPFPLAWASGKGNRLVDIDGLEYVDLLGEFTAGLYGHSDPIIQAAQRKAIEDGIVLGGPNQYEARLAAAICARFPSVELIRFTNSGTEANLFAISAARALKPDSPRVMVFEHGYHGGVFYFSPGHDRLNYPIPWLLAPYNDIEATRALLRRHGRELAAVIVEPMQGSGGCIPGTESFLRMLREECTHLDIALIFDEVMTSRLSPSGLQGKLGIAPDMTTFGKYLGGGTSFGAFGGKREMMAHFDPAREDSIPHAGTFNNNVISMAGGLAGLTQVFTPSEARRINELGDGLREKLNHIAARHGLPLQATGVGSLMNVHFSLHPIRVPADAHPQDPATERRLADLMKLFHLDLIDQGYYFARRGFIALSLPTSEADVEGFAAAVSDFLEARGRLIERTLSAA
jgi:glutamate-1-semialdehyde 2,1-aminomutase